MSTKLKYLRPDYPPTPAGKLEMFLDFYREVAFNQARPPEKAREAIDFAIAKVRAMTAPFYDVPLQDMIDGLEAIKKEIP